MISALDHAAAAIEKLVFNPFEWNADMRAAILVEINFALLSNREEFASGQIKPLAASFGDVSKGAKTQLIR